MEWYALSAEEVAARLGVDVARGLSAEEAARRLEQYGPNELESKGGPHPLRIFLRQFANILVIVLIVAALVSVLIGEAVDAVVIMGIVIINAILGFVQEYRAEQAVEALRRLAAPQATVLRDGVPLEVDATTVVPGDVLVLETGDKVPADARVIQAFNLETDEALLTGESLPVAKRPDPCPVGTDLAERTGMVFMGTHVTYGHGHALVTATGMRTEMGRIAAQVQQADVTHTSLERKLDVLARTLLIVVCGLCVLIFLAGWLWRGKDPLELFMTVVSLAVAAIPEGLPAVVTLALALSVRRMAARNAIVKRLAAAETLGATTVICSDKTGTMTANEMAVVRVYAGGDLYHVEADGYAPHGAVLRNGTAVTAADHRPLQMLAHVGVLCNDALLVRNDDWTIVGDPTEGALLPLARKLGVNEEQVRAELERIQEIAFDSERKRMTTLHRMDGRVLVATKGAAEEVLSRCAYALYPDGPRPLSAAELQRVAAIATDLADDALRVLALAYREVDDVAAAADPEELERDLVLVGLVGMIDPPRPEVADAIAECHRAGIQVKMVTGDHRATAAAIARELGLLTDGGRVVDGRELEEMSDEELRAQVEEITVFARMAPDHKVRILDALQARGHIVGMTGDGINDAPALKRADIGVGMAKKGTDVTREVADIVLADDNFASIVAAVREGRIVYDNIRKFTRFLLSANFGEMLIISFAVLAGWPLPLLPLQILWINLVTDGLPALALGMTRGEDDVMDRPPRNPAENMLADMVPYLVVVALLCAAGALGGFWWERSAGGDPTLARTVCLTQVVLFELFVVFNCQSDRKSFRRVGFINPHLFAAVLLSLILHLALIYVEPLRGLFHLGRLGPADWGRVLVLALPGLLISPRVLVRHHEGAHASARRAA